MKGHIKAIIIVFIILIIYTVLVYIYATGKNKLEVKEEPKQVNPEPDNPDDNTEIKEYDLNVVLFNRVFLGYKDGKWYENPSYDYTSKDFDFYSNGDKYSNMGLVYTDRWYVMDKEKNFVDYDNGFLAINNTKDYTAIPYKEEQLSSTNRSDIESFLQSKGLNYNYDTLKKIVMSYDLNRDGIRDDIYVLSNLFLEDYSGYDKTFAFAFVKTLNQNVLLFEDSYNAIDAVSLCDPYIEGIIGVDSTNALIIGCEYYSEGGTKYMLYKLDSKNATKLLETKAN